jgi:hypothetical protein
MPTVSSGGNALMIFSGVIRFGQDGDEGEDPRNERSPDYAELDGVDDHSPRTVMLRLRGPVLSNEQFKGSSAIAALSDLYLTTQDTFGAGTDNSCVLLTQPVEDGNELSLDLWLMSDVRAERSSGGSSLINRMAYQANVVLTNPEIAKSNTGEEPVMHGTDFVVDLDAANGDQIDSPRILDVGIQDGVQTFPVPSTSESANRLMIFTGTAICSIPADGDGELSRGVVRVRLSFPFHKNLHFIGSATVAALADIHGDDPEEALFAVDAAKTVVGPTDGGSIRNSNLPTDELYLIMDAAMMGADADLNRIAYQANVLVRDTEPDLDSILVRPAGLNVPFAPEAQVSSGEQWEYLLTLTGSVPGGPGDVFTVTLQSGDPQTANIDALHLINQLSGGQISASSRMNDPVDPVGQNPKTVTITATGKRVSKTAKLHIIPLPK